MSSILFGNPPVNWFLERFKDVRESSMNKDEGITPLKAFPSRFNTFKALKFPIESGMFPDSLLPAK